MGAYRWGSVWLLATAACGNTANETSSSTACEKGEIAHPSGEGCVAIGIQGCADVFVDSDGVCRPSLDDCPPGMIPDFEEGCAAVGIADCAPEFREGDGLCHPTIDKCPADTFAVPSVGCVPIDGAGCGTGTWGNIAVAPNTLWVDPTYVGGNGSMRQPFSTIAAALAVAVSGSRIALAAGDYDEPVLLDESVEIVGRCPSMVTIRGTQTNLDSPSPAIVVVDGAPSVRLRGVRLTGAGIGIFARASDVTVTESYIDKATFSGIYAEASTLALERVLVAWTTPVPDEGGGPAIVAQDGGEVFVSQSALERNGAGIFAGASAGITVRDSVIEKNGPGIQASGGSSLDVEGSALVENRGIAVLAMNANVSARESILEKTLSQEGVPVFGRGLDAQEGAKLTLASTAVVHNRDVALLVTGADASAHVVGSLVGRTGPEEMSQSHGTGIAVQDGGSLTLDTSAVVDNYDFGLIVVAHEPGRPAAATVTRSLIDRTLPQVSDATMGIGLGCIKYGQLAMTSSGVRRSHTVGVLVASQSSADITSSFVDEVFAGTSYDGSEGIGHGIAIAFESIGNLTSLDVRRAFVAGVLYDTSRGVLRDVRSVESRAGLALQGMPLPDWQTDGNFFEGSEAAVVVDAMLPVPGKI